MNKQFVSLNQALGYLQFLSTDAQAFTDKNFKPTAENSKQIKKVTPRLKTNQEKRRTLQANMDNQSDGKKNLNKNRAIKRIIDTSKQILQANQKYEQIQQSGQKSYVTQFNIYLKQYNRLCEQIVAQQNEKDQKKREFMSQQQDKLQNVYSYTVQQDFRQLVQVSILKDKINKGNVDMIMDTFKLCLVVLKPNQLRIYQNTHEDSPHRDIKVHQIQNVDYFSQPYIFTVMTIIKDKSTGSQYLCFRFDCVQKQHKWDRAVYCNYIVRKMKHRNKYFLLEFPDKQAQKRNQQGMEHIVKKRDDHRSYDLDKKRILKTLQNQRDKSKEKQGTRMGTAGIESQRDLPTVERRDSKMQRFNTDNQNFMQPARQNNYNMMSTKNADQKNIFDTTFKGNKSNPMQNSDTNKNKQQQISNGTAVKPIPPLNKQNSTQVKNNQNDPKQSPTSKQNKQPNSGTTIKQNKQPGPVPANLINMINPNLAQSQQFIMDNKQNQQQQKKIINPYTKRKIQLKLKHENGIKVTKIKFFSDKPKLVYFGNQQFQYWDFDETTFHKSQKKIILFKDIKTYKIVKQKNVYIYLQLTNKNLEFAGKIQDLNDIIQWIQLPKKQRQFQQNQLTAKSKKQQAIQPNIFLT